MPENIDGQFLDVRDDFPILERKVHGNKTLVYLDSAASSQKPRQVLSAMDDYYRQTNANIHRGVHTLAEEATGLYEAARLKVTRLINARHTSEVIYTRNTTESINLVAKTWAASNLKAGDLVILTEMEHHSNLVPWQMLAAEKQIQLEFIPVTGEGKLDLDVYESLLKQNPRLVSLTQMSNVLGTINPIKEICAKAHLSGAVVLVDAAQSVPHMQVDVLDLDVDFLAFSGHKMLGPTGIGVLYGKRSLLEKMPAFMGGGDMIRNVQLRSFTPNELPYKFEAGTPAIAEAVGLGAAVDYLENIGVDKIHLHEQALMKYAHRQLSSLSEVKIFGDEVENRGGVLAFEVSGIHPHDVAQILDGEGMAVRAGHHCAMPLHQKFGIPATTRASFYLYNTPGEVDLFIMALKKAIKVFN